MDDGVSGGASLCCVCVCTGFGFGRAKRQCNGSFGCATSGAELLLASKATGIGRTATANAAGLFTINALSSGDYDVKVSAKGFIPTTTQVKLEVGQQQELKVRLEVKAEQINVTINSTDAGPMVNTTSSLVDGVIGSQQINSLPLNGRNFLEMSLLVPGKCAGAQLRSHED